MNELLGTPTNFKEISNGSEFTPWKGKKIQLIVNLSGIIIEYHQNYRTLVATKIEPIGLLLKGMATSSFILYTARTTTNKKAVRNMSEQLIMN
jgi:hypothetical protein